jgi:hypothetical protein
LKVAKKPVILKPPYKDEKNVNAKRNQNGVKELAIAFI